VTPGVLNLAVAGASLFLIGVNLAILYRFWPEPWLSAKVLAVSGLLTYVMLSVLLAHPSMWRVTIGLAAVMFDCGAVWGMWSALDTARRGDGVLVAYRRR
jgi:hypothetical protein